MIVAVDWSHIKQLTTYDGEKVRVESANTLINRIQTSGEESKKKFKSRQTVNSSDFEVAGEFGNHIQSPACVIEKGCPKSLIYKLASKNINVYLIDSFTTSFHRKVNNIEKTDENDAKIIWLESNNGAKLEQITLDAKELKTYSLYYQYRRYQKARVAMMQMMTAHQRGYGDADLSPYQIAIDTLHKREKDVLKELSKIYGVKRGSKFNLPNIKGIGRRLWIGLMVTANPKDFKSLCSYLRFCGLTGDVIQTHKYNRHARMLYHLFAEKIVQKNDPNFRPLYDKLKTDMAIKYSGKPKYRINNAALNRTATFLAKEIFRYCKNGT